MQLTRSCLQDECSGNLKVFRICWVKKLFWELLRLRLPRRKDLSAGLSADILSCVIDAWLLASHDQFHIYALTRDRWANIFLLVVFFRRSNLTWPCWLGDTGQNDWQLIDQLKSEIHSRDWTVSVGFSSDMMKRTRVVRRMSWSN